MQVAEAKKHQISVLFVDLGNLCRYAGSAEENQRPCRARPTDRHIHKHPHTHTHTDTHTHTHTQRERERERESERERERHKEKRERERGTKKREKEREREFDFADNGSSFSSRCTIGAQLGKPFFARW